MTYPDMLDAEKYTIIKDVDILGTTLPMVRSRATEAMPRLSVILLTRFRAGFTDMAVAAPTLNICRLQTRDAGFVIKLATGIIRTFYHDFVIIIVLAGKTAVLAVKRKERGRWFFLWLDIFPGCIHSTFFIKSYKNEI